MEDRIYPTGPITEFDEWIIEGCETAFQLAEQSSIEYRSDNYESGR